MNKETRKQIEKDAKEYYETFGYTTAAHKLGYIAGATTQYPKAWNAAIDAAIEKTEKVIENVDPIFQIAFHALANELKSLKLDPNQA